MQQAGFNCVKLSELGCISKNKTLNQKETQPDKIRLEKPHHQAGGNLFLSHTDTKRDSRNSVLPQQSQGLRVTTVSSPWYLFSFNKQKNSFILS